MNLIHHQSHDLVAGPPMMHTRGTLSKGLGDESIRISDHKAFLGSRVQPFQELGRNTSRAPRTNVDTKLSKFVPEAMRDKINKNLASGDSLRVWGSAMGQEARCVTDEGFNFFICKSLFEGYNDLFCQKNHRVQIYRHHFVYLLLRKLIKLIDVANADIIYQN